MKYKINACAPILCFILFITIFSGQTCSIGFGAEAPDLKYDSTKPVLTSLKQQPGITESYGEIISIAPMSLILWNQRALQHYFLSPQACLFCNGTKASWKSLIPVTPDSFFEARLLINQNAEVIAIDGYYYGEVCVIKDWLCREGRIHSLKIYSPGAQITAWRIVTSRETPPGSFPSDLNWLGLEREIFILYNLRGEIRAIFLPEG